MSTDSHRPSTRSNVNIITLGGPGTTQAGLIGPQCRMALLTAGLAMAVLTCCLVGLIRRPGAWGTAEASGMRLAADAAPGTSADTTAPAVAARPAPRRRRRVTVPAALVARAR